MARSVLGWTQLALMRLGLYVPFGSLFYTLPSVTCSSQPRWFLWRIVVPRLQDSLDAGRGTSDLLVCPMTREGIGAKPGSTVLNQYDLNKNSTLDRRELGELLSDMGERAHAVGLEAIFAKVDTDQSNEISLAEVGSFVSSQGRGRGRTSRPLAASPLLRSNDQPPSRAPRGVRS